MGKRVFSFVLALCVLLSLSSCTGLTVFDARTLMSPPTATADQQAIYKLLQGGGTDINFAYPKNGEYRSAIIMKDFTGDGEDDAIGFYTPENGTGSVEVQFLIKREGEWVSASTFKSSALQIDRVCFTDLTGDGVQDVLIGWGSTAGSTGRIATVSAYLFNGFDITELPLGSYGEMAVTDLNDDGREEVFTIDMYVPAEEEGEDFSPARARVYTYARGVMQERYSTDADNSISSYSSVKFVQLSKNLSGVLVDGYKADGSMTTQVFYLDSGEFVTAPADVNTEEYANPFTRPAAAALNSRDINGDGIYDIPRVRQLPAISEDTVLDTTSFQIEWCEFQKNGIPRMRIRSLLNATENYLFALPFQLEGKVTAVNNPENRSVTYRLVTPSEEDANVMEPGAVLFNIRVFARQDWDALEWTNYEPLITQTDTVYAIQVVTADTAMVRFIEDIKTSFRLISE